MKILGSFQYIIGHTLALECAKETEIARLSSEKGQRQFSRCLLMIFAAYADPYNPGL